MEEYLHDIAVDFERLLLDATAGRYDDPFFGSIDDADHKLRLHLVNMARAFGAAMKLHGATYNITSAQSGSRFQTHKPEEHDPKALVRVPAELQKYMEMYTSMIVHPETITETDFCAKIQQHSASNRGEEICGMGVKLMMKVFQLQSHDWESIAQVYAGFVAQVIKACMEEILRHIIGNDSRDVLDGITKHIIDPFFAIREKILKAKIAELIRPYQGSQLWITYEPEFRDRLASRTVNRLSDYAVNTMVMELGLTQPGSSDNLFGAGPANRNKLRAAFRESQDITSTGPGLANEKVLDMMLTYYEMSLRTFTDNVVNLAIEPCLVGSVARMLTTQMVDRMSAEKVEELVGETEASRACREKIQREVTKLEEVLGVCQPHMPKEKTVLPFLSGSNHHANAPIPPAPAVAPNGTNGATNPAGPFSEAEWLKGVPTTKYMDPDWYHDLFDPSDPACFQRVRHVSFYNQEHSAEEIRVKDYSMGLGI